MVTDSIAPGHAGMPQDCASGSATGSTRTTWTSTGRSQARRYAQDKPFSRATRRPSARRSRPRRHRLIIDGNRDLVRNNWIYDNWRFGEGSPSCADRPRGEDPTGQSDPPPSYDLNNNGYTGNRDGRRAERQARPERHRLLVGRGGRGQLLGRQPGPAAGALTNVPTAAARLPGRQPVHRRRRRPSRASCSPARRGTRRRITDPPGCDWFKRPPEPK